MTPRSRRIAANRLEHHLLEWGDRGPLVLLLHGFLEHAHAWDWVAPRVAAAGHRVLALDWRGHGDSQWVGAGGYYHFADYVADLAGIVRQLDEPAALVAHSMGGNAAILFAGTEPARVSALVAVEGLGPFDADPEHTPERYAAWIDDLQRQPARPRAPFTLAAASDRLRQRYPRLSPEALALLAEHGTRAVDGGRQWKFDPLHQTRSPQPFYTAQARPFWRRVTCPVLYIDGGDSTLRLPEPELQERLTLLRATRATIAGAAHHPHLEQPEALASVLIRFLAPL
ncbi:MAG: alpha/beta fold hydrolase [Candidatus Binatia bacterium]